ncbi:MAG: sterol desaturase family protein [Deltaproteobacteria bacterium]|nr:sterol desaturase family protein [Deltaproteobacteria bacterium]MBW2072192.1 sterol desaturase family protein [Deltaproteobacteria bacterium]
MSNEIPVRVGFFLGVFALMAVWELLAPRRGLTTSKTVRWLSNLGIILINAGAVRLVVPILPVSLALLAEKNGWGLLNNLVLPDWLKVAIGVVVLDLVIYFQHVMFHAVPAFWRLHMMHHADLDFDVTTGLRFHPIEILLSAGIKLATVAALGPPTLAVLLFEILLNGTSMFNHGNIRLPASVDRLLRLLVVTPDMHRVHHSVVIKETNSNFGFNLPWWDRLFGTYRDQPAAGHRGMTIGLSQFRHAQRLTLPWMLVLPFTGDPGEYALNRGGGKVTFRR